MLTLNLYAQQHRKHSGNKTTLADAGEDNYDIKYLRFNLNVADTSVHISGDVSTTAQVVTPMSEYVFELDTLMTIDSARVDGVWCSVTTSAPFIRKLALPWTLSAGSVFTAQIFYHGVPPPGGGFFNGLTHAVSTHGTHMVYTISDPWVAQDWWPAKQSVDDKIDSVDMFVTVPSGVADGSNGVLVNVDTVTTPGFATYHWQTHYPITYYLISIAVARYAQEKYYHHFPGSTDSMLIQNFFIDTATFYPSYKSGFDSIGMIIDYYDSLYGRYPFWQEKYGVCYTSLPGGMEHQTMTTIGVPYTWVIAHELTHQWFGDHVSYLTWGDVWLSEGFATFDEQLFYEHFWSPYYGWAHRNGYLIEALGDACGEVYVTDTTTAGTIFYQPTVYAKGQGVVTMLRYLAPQDSLFFKGLRTYQQTYGFSNASTADLKAIMETAYGGMNLDTFFNQWIYGKGYPVYSVRWNQTGSDVVVRLVQTRSCASYNTTFSTPLELELHSGSLDTIVKVYNNLDTQWYTFNWSPPMDTLMLNPDVWTICKQNGAIVHDPYLGVTTVLAGKLKVSPNPSANNWRVDGLEENTALVLTDMNGRIIWQGKSTSGTTTIPGEKLPPGDYLLKLGNSNTDSIKLVHW
jgi:aminopeptidase N